MEPKVIRWGSSWSDPPRAATLDDIADALEGIAAGRIARPEFTIEYASRREAGNGPVVEGDPTDRPHLILAHFLPDDASVPEGWYVTYDLGLPRRGEVLRSFALAWSGCRGGRIVEGNCCGGDLELRSDFLVPAALVLEAAGPYLDRGVRAPGLNWLPDELAYRPHWIRPDYLAWIQDHPWWLGDA